jgi:hypothetical protein
MEPLGRIAVSRVSLFLGAEAAEVARRPVVRYLRLPAPVSFFHPREAAHALKPVSIFSVRPAIGPVLAVHSKAKIAKTIIGPLAINVVNLERRHFPRHIKPSKAMGGITFAVNLDVDVPLSLFNIPSNRTDAHFWAWRAPAEDAGFGNIGEGDGQFFAGHKYMLPDREADCKQKRGF